MPRVANYGGPQVRTTVTQQPLADAGPGDRVFRQNERAIQSAGAAGLAITQAAVEHQRRVDTTSAEEALVSFERDKNNLFFNPDNGYFKCCEG